MNLYKRHFKRLFFIVILLVGKWNFLFCQDVIGQSSVLNFNFEDIKAGTQTWMITQDKFGIMYFGNSEGLLTYNGSEWNLYPLPNKTTLRSVIVAPDGKIYAGGQNEFGYFFPSENGTLIFHSLKNIFPKSQQSFGDAWNATLTGKEIFFRCSDKIFHIDERKKTKVFPTESEWLFLGTANGKVFAQDRNKGLLYFDNGGWKLLTQKTNNTIVTSIMPLSKDSILFSTLKSGVFILAGNNWTSLPIDKTISQYHIYNAIKIGDTLFALGTTSNGVFIIDKKGKTIRHLSRNTQLQNNNVLSMYMDNQSNLWLGLDRGIDMVNNDAAIQKINPVLNTPAACYTAKIFNHNLYIGTSDGLYSLPISLSENEDVSNAKGTFSRIENSGGQVWGLFSIDDKLLMGHNDGAFVIENNKANQIYKGPGTWIFRTLSDSSKSYTDVLAGTYYALNWLRLNGKKISDSGKIKNSLYESFRFMEIDSANRVIWAAHPYRGIYKMKLDSSSHAMKYSKLYTSKDGLPDDLENYVYKIRGQIIFCTTKGIYAYNEKKDRFEQDKFYGKIFGNIPIRFITEDNQNRLWFAARKKLGVVLKNNEIKYFSEITDKLIDGFEFIYPLNDQNIFVGSVDGLVHINFKKYQHQQNNIELLLSKVITFNQRDSVLFNGYFTENEHLTDSQSTAQIKKLPAAFNSFHFQFTSPHYVPQQPIEYAYQLVGFEQNWSRWSNRNEKDYTNLPYGKYTFLARARDSQNHESKIVKYSFIILPHWYQTNLAYLIYSLIFISLIWLIKKYQLNKFQKQKEKYEKEQAQLQYLHQLEIEHNENAIIQLQKEKLENEISYKNKELASTTMHLFKRGKLLSKLKEELTDAIKKLPKAEDKSDFTKLVKMLSEAEKQDNDWEQFAIHFDDVHNNFLQNLKHIYPNLTQADLRICAYLKMNLSSKEIAQFLNISLKSVEIARYRLRKKLNITDSNVNLYDFLIET
ncbi:MAG: triple tyrosine motif-containing protein [Arachidicoccus sp.]|nr:triple tyrosine motif-containing protein [Arachidicoccus sp.]